MKLFRVNNPKKTKDGEVFNNPNYGRFFFARKVQVVDEDGMNKYNDKGYPEEDLADFEWVDMTNYVRAGAFAYAAADNPGLTALIIHCRGDAAHALGDAVWPVAMIKGL